MLSIFLPKHGENLAGSFRVGTALIAMELRSDILQSSVSVGTKELSHLQFIVGTRSGRLRDTSDEGHGVAIVTFVSVEHLAVAFGKAGIGAELVRRKRVSGHAMRVLVLICHVVHVRSHGAVHGELMVGGLHVGSGLEDHVLGRHLRSGHVLAVRVLVMHPLASIHAGGISESRAVHVVSGGAVDGGSGSL